MSNCVILGAGISGLFAARVLQDAGIDVTLVDKGRGVGGRMATRRRNNDIHWDHGAQFITVRESCFQKFIDQWLDSKVAKLWANGFLSEGSLVPDVLEKFDGHPRYCGTSGMSSIPKYMAEGLDIRLNEKIVRIEHQNENWRLHSEGSSVFESDILVLTAPVPQSLELLDSSEINIENDNFDQLRRVEYDPCFAIMLEMDRPSSIPEPGGMRFIGEPIAWIGDNQQKGISNSPSLTIHTGPVFSSTYFEKDKDKIAELIIESAQPFLSSNVISYQVHRWKYSVPKMLYPKHTLVLSQPGLLAFAGDAFNGPRVEGAAISGIEAANTILEQIS